VHDFYSCAKFGENPYMGDSGQIGEISPFFIYTFLVAPLALRSATHIVRMPCVCLSVCVWKICFPINPYLQAGLTDLDEIWHDGRS